jgi:type IV pilus assembly protein PilM
MFNFIKKAFPKRCLGIDIGTSNIKVVEIYRIGNKKRLENYGQISSAGLSRKGDILFSSQNIAESIKSIISEMKTKTRQVVFSIPDFSTFFTNLELPPMTKEELSEAVKYEARRYIPLPINEITLDWQIIGDKSSSTNFKILLVAVPNEVVAKYREIAVLSELQLVSLEAEAFSLMRALVGENENQQVALIDIGAKSTVCSIIDGKILKRSHSLDMSGNAFSSAIAKSLNIDLDKAEELKKQWGIINNAVGKDGQIARKALLSLLEVALREIKEILEDFYKQEGKEIQKIIIAGGASLLPGLPEYFKRFFGKKVEIGNPFLGVSYPPILNKTVFKMSTSFAIAAGSALRGLEY